MSFGEREYQHRYYKLLPQKRMSFAPSENQIIPFPLNQYSSLQSPPYIAEKTPLSNQINLRVRPKILRRNEIGWDGYKLANYVVDKYADDYVTNELILERFRREAEQYKRRNRLLKRTHAIIDPYYDVPVIRYHTQPREYLQSSVFPPLSVSYVKPNPQVNLKISNYDTGVASRLDHLERDRELIESKLKIANQKQKLGDYKKKYSKLKQKLKQEVMNHRLEETFRRRQQEVKIQSIEKVMGEMNRQLQNNSKMLDQTLRMNDQMRMSAIKNLNSLRFTPVKRVYQSQILLETVPSLDELTTKLVRPKIVYHMRDLNQQYEQMSKLQRQINLLTKKTSKRYS